MRRRGILRAFNERRRARRRAEDFGPKGEWIRSLRCATHQGRPPLPPSEPSHVRTRGAGHGAEALIPQCFECHALMHAIGVKTFARARGVDLAAEAELYEKAWLGMPAGERAQWRERFAMRWPEAAAHLEDDEKEGLRA